MPGERVGDHGFFLRREARVARNLLDVIAIGFGRRNAARGGVRLLEESGIRQIGHHVADGGRAQALAVRARERARSDRLAGGDEGLHDGGQNFAFAVPDIGVSGHTAFCQLSQSERRSAGEKVLPVHSITILDAEA